MAIMKDGIKYACATCIRGHRVKKCQHTDRPLVAVLKRGRQVSQCNHCREHRTKSGSHVKCTCAIANVPNPINGCLCEVIHTCNCVPKRLRDTSTEQGLTDFTNNGPQTGTPDSMLDFLYSPFTPTSPFTSPVSTSTPPEQPLSLENVESLNLFLQHDLNDILI
ncbi:copper-fist-domain-containing protein [Hesseltinella vesiculosa]|uniref:Copper-fist-domain-containing protein n=1 Tax=Hesseltinella vesiculosa TaxID=101127 RepID=A0A1X2GSU1_9FUNG|nr:copper-fist-domain-containing protein [Hesseltinella vesiculosa]